MKYLRFALICLGIAAALLGLCALAVISPPVQTWFAQTYLAGGALVHGTVESVDANNGRADVSDLRLESKGALLTLPSIEANLSVTDALLRRHFGFTTFSAKGWMLDLTKCEGLVLAPAGGSDAPAAAATMPAEKAVAAVLGLVGAPAIPWDVALDGVDLEGDVLLPPRSGTDPMKIHLVVSGGGLSPGHEGKFTVDLTTATTDAELHLTAVNAHGEVTVSMDAARAVNRLSYEGDLVLKNPSLQNDLKFNLTTSLARGALGQTYTFVVRSEGRTPLELHGQFSAAERSHKGTWRLNLTDWDIRALLGDKPLPRFVALGTGSFETDTGLTRLGLSGEMAGKVAGLEALEPALAPLGTLGIGAEFTGTVTPGDIQVGRLAVRLRNARPVLDLKTLQGFSVRTATGEILPTDPKAGLLTLRLEALPTDWFANLEPTLTLPGGTLMGECTVGASDGGFTLDSSAPLAVSGASLSVGTRRILDGLFLSFGLHSDWSPKGRWNVGLSSMDVALAGRHLASIQASAANPGADGAVPVSCRFGLDLAALPRPPDAPLLGWSGAKALTGEIHASVGNGSELDSKLELSGRKAGESMAASLHVDLDGDGSAAFLGPVKVTTAEGTSEITADGTWNWSGPSNHITLKLTAPKVSLDHLSRLLGPVVSETDGSRDRGPAEPFWGDWQGSVAGSFDTLVLPGRELANAAGTLELEHGELSLLGGRGTLKDLGTARVNGAIAFHPGAANPYELTGTATLGTWDASRYFGLSEDGHSPLLEGKFQVDASLGGAGSSLAQVLSGMTGSLHLHAVNGIFRLLETHIEDTIPQVDAPVKDALSSVGSAVGTIFGRRDTPIYALGKNPVNPHAESVIRLANDLGELGFDSMDVKATRSPDGTVLLDALDFQSADTRLTGSGRIGVAPDGDLGASPILLVLKLGAKGDTAGEIKKAGLLSDRTDSAGYTLLAPEIRLAGTMKKVDASSWHDALAKAAKAPSDPK